MPGLSRYSRQVSDKAIYHTPPGMRPYLSAAKDWLSLAFKPHLKAVRLTGAGAGGSLTVNYIGITYVKDYLTDLLFEADPAEAEIGKIPVWGLGQALDKIEGDLTFVVTTKYVTHTLAAHKGVTLPFLVNQVLDVRGEWDDIVKRFHPKLRRHELRLVRKYNYEYELSAKAEDFDFFYRNIYRPSMKGRHGSLAHLASYKEARNLFDEGVLLLLKRANEYVSGSLCQHRLEPGVVHFRYTGVLQADLQLLKEGAQGAAYYAVVHWANQQGYEAVDFEATEPYLKKGIFQYKRKWGVRARLLPNLNMHKRIWLKIHRNTPAVTRFLKDNPCLTIDDQGHMQGLFFSDDPAKASAKEEKERSTLCSMTGIDGYQTHTVKDFLD